MSTIADLKAELEEGTTLNFISSAFTEASAARIGRIRSLFEANRQFYDEISHVYHLVRLSSLGLDLAKSKESVHAKVLSVAVTSNQRFYGNLNAVIMRSFLEAIGSGQTDNLVIGATGHDYMKAVDYKKPFNKMIFVHDDPTSEETRSFLDTIMPYDAVVVYHPKFVSLVTQTVGTIDITQAMVAGDKTSEDEIHMLFEPESLKILEFFQRQVRALLFLHVMLEANLSRTAARLITMSNAEERSAELIKKKHAEIRKLQASIVNEKLLETFAGMRQWKDA